MNIINKKLDELLLNIDNPRFAELYAGSKKEDDLIEYLLYNEAAQDVAQNIVNMGQFFPDRPLWVIKKDNKFLVRDGNRRCAAVKALQNPDKFSLNLPKSEYKEIPVLIYEDEKDLDRRILQEHTQNLFKKWDRIAKALEVYKKFNSGSSIESMIEIDSKPIDLIKLASFYYEAVKIGGEDFKILLRRGRGETGGKTIIFERLFKFSENCGYRFKGKPTYSIDILDEQRFDSYIRSMILYLQANPKISHTYIDNERIKFLKELENYGFESNNSSSVKNKKKTISKKKLNIDTEKKEEFPLIERDHTPELLIDIIKECYDLDAENFSNAKMALARVVFECILKYVVENTEYNSKKLAEYSAFRDAFYNGHGKLRKFTDFSKLKTSFESLILKTGKSKIFINFELEKLHQVIHNYDFGAMPVDAKAYCKNLKPLIEFMLQKEDGLINSIDVSKL